MVIKRFKVMMSRTQPRKKDRKAYQGEYPGKFNQ